MENFNSIILQKTGFVLVLISLFFSWTLVIYRYILKIDEQKINTGNLLKAHLDFFLMGVLLLVFSLLKAEINPTLILLSCIGACTNPTMFVVLAFYPQVNKAPKSVFGLTTTLSYIFTTVGIGGICISCLSN